MRTTLYFPNTCFTRLLLLVTALQGVLIIGLECYVFVTVQNDLDPAAFQVPAGRTVKLYLCLFILAYIFELIIVYDALHLSSMIQVVGVCVYNLFLMAYAAVQPFHVRKDLNLLTESLASGIRPLLPPDLDTWHRVRPVLLAVASVQAVATAALLYIAFKLHSEFAWLVYKVVHADLSMKRRLLNFQIYITFVKFDYFLILSFLVQVITLLDQRDPEFVPSILGIFLATIILFLAIYCVQIETRWETICIIVAYFGTVAYLAYKLSDTFLQLNYLVVLMAAISLAMITCTIVMAILCMTNFDRGLKRYTMPPQKIPEDTMYLGYTRQHIYAPSSPRIEID